MKSSQLGFINNSKPLGIKPSNVKIKTTQNDPMKIFNAKSIQYLASRSNNKWLKRSFCISWFVTIVIFSVHFIQYAMYNSIPRTGEVTATLDLELYGFGSQKRLVIINITKIGSVSNIDPTDKKVASATFSYIDDANITQREEYPIQVELKGDGFSERDQLNFDIELCDDPECNDDTKEKLFGWGEKYEDYILRGGFLEPGLVRDIAPTVMPQKSYESVPVELLIANGNVITYEGVYNFMQKIGRRMYEKNNNWSKKGKVPDCEDLESDPKEINETGIIFKNEVDRPGRSKLSPTEKEYNVKMVYPKNYIFHNTSEKFSKYESCPNTLRARYLPFYQVTTMQNTSFVDIDYQSVAISYLMVQLMQQSDFGYKTASTYWVVRPESNTLQAGTLYDFDGFWRILPMTKTLDYSIINMNEISPIWKSLGKDPRFIHNIRESGTTLETAYTNVNRLYEDQLRNVESGYFDRHLERWPIPGRKIMSVFRQPIQLLYGYSLLTKPTMKEELIYQQNRLTDRYNTMKELLETVESIHVHNLNWVRLFFKQHIAFLISLLISVIISITLSLLKLNKNTNMCKHIKK